VTAKGRLRSADGPRSFRTHALWAFVGAALLGSSAWFGYNSIALRFWAALSVLVGVLPPLIAFFTRLRNRRIEEPEEELPAKLIMTIRATASTHGSLNVSDLPTVPGIPAIPRAGLPAVDVVMPAQRVPDGVHAYGDTA
jgi:hypothetical protein